VILDIGGGNYATYAHFQPNSILVNEGDRISRGDVLALVGNSGNSLAPHCTST
jgi:murein DD-endopeptidase MepM/ murein hydrolase activator NlpD